MCKGEVLVVDDTAANLEVVAQVLEDAGYEVASALGGDRALKLAASHPPDLILLDIQMPGMDGFETCARLKNTSETAVIPVIFMTALSDSQSKVRGFELGAVDYITKPFEERELLARVNNHVLLHQLNKELESRIQTRTDELQQASIQLHESQLQLVQNEKMSALGSMMAGIAHEINNPLGFISSSIKHANSYVQDLLEHLELYQEYTAVTDPIVQENAEDINLEFLAEDLPKMLTSMKMATHRLKDLSKSLRTFSRSDTESLSTADIHEVIDSTLLILKYRLRGDDYRSAIEVRRQYSELPPIQCYPGQLNQVLMNILANAVDMFDEMAAAQTTVEATEAACDSSIASQTITISTNFGESNTAEIRIRDNGKGMPEAVREKIFDRTFTTKAVGKGTGLGLSIARQIIVENHGGDIAVSSEISQGTEFLIRLPVVTEASDS